jgi:molecular chaperone GrpE (heat shock protein)
MIQKRFEKEKDQIKVFAISKFAKDLLEVGDSLGRILKEIVF